MRLLFQYYQHLLLLVVVVVVVVYDVHELKIVDEDMQENDHIVDLDVVQVVLLIYLVVDEMVMN